MSPPTPIRTRPELLSTPPAAHGAFDFAELEALGLDPDQVVDFSVNSNPHGPPPGVREVIAEVPLERYPDRDCLALKRALAARHAIDETQIVVGNGSAELLQLIAQAFIEQGDTVAIPAITFSEYARVSALAGARIRTLDWPAPDCELSESATAAMASAIDGARVVFLCNPNNPDGRHLPVDWICRYWVRAFPETLFVLDEAYANFLGAPDSAIGQPLPNLLVLRSLTKDYALAGLRLGYLTGDASLIEGVSRARQAWNVNALAQAAGIFVLDQHDWLRQSMAQLNADKSDLCRQLQSLGLEPLPSAVHYFLLPVGDAREFRSRLLAQGIQVRDAASFGLPHCVRIATRSAADNARLCRAIASL